MRVAAMVPWLVIGVLWRGAGIVVASGAEPVPPYVVACPTQTAPTIDGMIQPEEWAGATQMSGFMTLGEVDLAKQITTIYITFDDENLYIAYDSRIAGGRPNASDVARDGSVWGGDSVEVSIAPPWMEEGQYYHFIGNYRGSIFDAVKMDAVKTKGGFDTSWNGNWVYANYLWEGVWSLELAIPLADLRVDEPWGRWRMNFGRSEGTFTSWAFTGRGYHNPAAYGTVELCRTGPVPKISVIRGLTAGDLRIRGTLLGIGTGSGEATLTARLDGDLKARPPLTPDEGEPHELQRTVRVPVEGEVRVSLRHMFADPRFDRLHVELTSAKRLLYRTEIPFTFAPPRYIELLPHPEEDQALLAVDLRRLKEHGDVDVEADVLDAAGTSIDSFRWPVAASVDQAQERIPTAKLATGDNPVTLRVRDRATGKILREEAQAFTKRESPEWYRVGKTLGRERRVIAPWTPIRVNGDVLSVWGRDYVLGDTLVCAQIASAKQSLLTEPLTLEGTIDGRPVGFRFGRREMLEQADDIVRWRTHGTFGPLEVVADSTLEFDGMVKVGLRFAGDAQIERLALRISLRPESSSYHHLARSYYETAKSGLVPASGLTVPFTPLVWLGSLKQGLMWFAESTSGWPAVGEEPIRVMPGKDCTTLAVLLADQRCEIKGGCRLEFGLHPTPVKPMPKGWRGWILGGRYDDATPLPDEMVRWRMLLTRTGANRQYTWRDESKQLIQVGHTTPLKLNAAALKKQVDADHARGIKSVMYEYLGGPSVGRTTDFERYVREWEKIPRKKLDYGVSGFIHGGCLGSTWSDFLLFGMKTLVERTGMDGVYWDGGSGPSLCGNALHGHAPVERSFPIFAARDFQKRLARMYDGMKGPGEYVVWNHNSQCLALPMLSFSTAVLDGESPFQKVRDGGPKLPELVELDYLRVMATGEPWGIVPSWLVYYRKDDPSVLRATYATILPHGAPIYPLGGIPRSAPDADLTLRTWQAFSDFRIGDAEFVGYWENSDWVTLAPAHPRIICSLYVRPEADELLLVLANLSQEEQSISVSVDKSSPALRTKQAHDVLRDTPMTWDGRTLSTRLARYDYALIALR